MAQTRRKRRTKHRGNAAGRVEARGRTGRKPGEGEKKPVTRAQIAAERRAKPPTWKSAAGKSAFASVVLLLFIVLDLFKTNTTTVGAITMALIAFILYTPLTYFLDRIMYDRRQRKAAQAKK